MNGYAYSEDGVLLGNFGEKANEAGHSATTAGTFSLRRTLYLNETGKPQLSDELQLELIKLFRQGNADAKRKMIAHNMHLLVATVKRFANRGVPLLDLILHGNHGLIHAFEKFELGSSDNFQIFAEQCICQHIEQAVRDRNISPSKIVPGAAHTSHATPPSMQSFST